MSKGGVPTPRPPSSPFHQHSSVGCSECWLANAKFSLFLRYFFSTAIEQIFWTFHDFNPVGFAIFTINHRLRAFVMKPTIMGLGRVDSILTMSNTKVTEVLDLAREQQHPLQCVLEPSASI